MKLRSPNACRCVIAWAALATCTAWAATTGKYEIVQLPHDALGSHTDAVFSVGKQQHVVVGENRSQPGGKYRPTTWVSFSAPAEWFAEAYSALVPSGGGTIRGAAFSSSVADGILVGDAEDGAGSRRAVAWRGGLTEVPPTELLPEFQASTATDAILLPPGGNGARFGVVGRLTLQGGATRGFYCLPEVGDEVIVSFVGLLPTLGGRSCEATAIAKTPGGVRIVGRAQNSRGRWIPCKWEGPDFDQSPPARGRGIRANAVEYGLITALKAPGGGIAYDIDTSATFISGAVGLLGGVTAPQVWRRNAQGKFNAMKTKLPPGLIEGHALGVTSGGTAVGTLRIRKDNRVRRMAFLYRPSTGPQLLDLAGKVVSGEGIFEDIFSDKSPTGIAADGVICGEGPARGQDPTLPRPFLLLPPG